MPLALLVRITPAGPWRNGPHTGSRDRVDPVCHSDSLFAALTGAMAELYDIDEWLDSTARAAAPAVRLTSLFPFLREDLYVPPPKTLWPPNVSGRLRASGARFVPARVVSLLASGQSLREDGWEVDGMSQCLVPRSGRPGHSGPFRYALRTSAAVDRLNGSATPHQTACIEFAQHAGYWCAATFDSESAGQQWRHKVEAAFRLLGDTGLGGERSRGWGRASGLRFQFDKLATLLMPRSNPLPASSNNWWLLSLYDAAPADSIDWTAGNYSLSPRSGRTTTGALKGTVDLIAEGSVLSSSAAPLGRATDITPEGHPHTVFRSGFAVALALPDVIQPPAPEPAAAASELEAELVAATTEAPE
ncbi:MAG TPA: type III-A CRISPR-associated RAMP protein Csm4 [Bryobacteraceae bacterium]|nr:type III-A CRISPR-associated RAMP protein Csm4 [Bryobacteraceae bacterium]